MNYNFMIHYRKRKKRLLACSVIAIFQDDKHSNNYLLFLGNNSTRKPSNDLFPSSVSYRAMMKAYENLL